MASKKNQSHRATAPAILAPLLNGVRVFMLLAMVVSAYLAWVSLSHGRVVGCGPDSACDSVLQSRWSSWFGIPVSLLALAVDALILGWSFRLGPAAPPALQRKAWAWIVPCAALVVGAAIWFVGLQVFAVQAVCPYCLVAHAAGFVASLLLLILAPLRPAPASSAEHQRQVYLSPSLWKRGVVLAVAGLAGLVAGQVAFEPRGGNATHQLSLNAAPGTNPAVAVLEPVKVSAPSNAAAAYKPETNAASAAPPRPTPHLFPVYGRFQLDLKEVPVMGPATNERVVVSLFDYTCHHCRAMHPLLEEVQRMFSNRLVIVSLPMPLDPGCNPTMLRPNPKHTNACAYAHLGLTVWRADRTKHREFDDWLMTGETPPSLPEAVGKAMQLVGTNALAQASRDPWVVEQLKMDVGLYEVAYAEKHGSMPQLIIGNSVAEGTYLRPELLKLLEQTLGLKAEPAPP